MSLVGAWLAHAAFAAEPPAPRKTGDAVKAAAEAHARAKARVRESAEKLEAAPAPAALRKASRASGAQLEAQIQAHITAAKEQAKTYLAPFRERLELEVHYIERTCDLRGDEAAALGKQAAESGESRQQELAKA
ncbi:MAG TPA: hypothetical protein VFW87_21995, partial [Pirellulales bacterium]|nr:hypothetical protein [Pirellulales bacterium]